MLDIATWSQSVLKEIEHTLNNLLTISGNKCKILLEAIRYSSLDGGKRIRPQFTVAAGMLSEADRETTIIIGCAIEMIHCFSLIHDDLPIMDNDDLRRGRPTNHKVYGDAIALLAGDALHATCFEILSSVKLQIAIEKKLAIINLVAQSIGVQGMVGGQAIDWLSTDQKINLAELQDMHSLKTGALLRSAILAGYLAGGNICAKQYADLDIIAQKIGLLFQIVDDIIDVTEDTSTLGKTANKDLINNKATYVNILGLENAQKAAKELFVEVIALIKLQNNSEALAYLADNVYYRHS